MISAILQMFHGLRLNQKFTVDPAAQELLFSLDLPETNDNDEVDDDVGGDWEDVTPLSLQSLIFTLLSSQAFSGASSSSLHSTPGSFLYLKLYFELEEAPPPPVPWTSFGPDAPCGITNTSFKH